MDANVDEDLRITGETFAGFRESSTEFADRLQQLESRKPAVADQAFTREDDVAGLIAAKLCSGREQFVKNVFIADACPYEFDPFTL